MALPYSDPFDSIGAGLTQVTGEWTAAGTLHTNSLGGGTGAVIVTNSTAHAATADMKVSITHVDTTNFDGGPIARYQSVDKFYYVDFTYAASNAPLVLYRRDDSSPLTEVEIASTTVASPSANKVIRLEVTGTGATVTLKAYYDNVEKINTTDAAAGRITQTGYAGVLDWNSGDDFDNLLVEAAEGGAATVSKSTRSHPKGIRIGSFRGMGGKH